MDLLDAPILLWSHFGRRTEYLQAFGANLCEYLFREAHNQKSIKALNGEEAIQFAFQHVSFARWAHVTKWHFVSSTRGF